MSLKRKAADVATDAVKKPKANAAITSFFGQPKPNPSTSSTNPSQPASSPTASATVQPNFDKEAWIAKLSDEQKQLLKLEIETLHESWLAVLKDEVTSKEFLDLKRFLKKEVETGKKVFPPSEDVYSWYVPDFKVHLLVTDDISKVTPYSSAQCQSSNPRARSIPQPQPGTWTLLLCEATDTSATVSQEHVHGAEKGLPKLLTTSPQRGSAHTLG